MKYLFFDLECANCFGGTGKIYSVGYVFTDENLVELSAPVDLVINPRDKFDWYVKEKMLAYDINYVFSQKDFRESYPTIKNLFRDVVAVGFDVERDVAYLIHDCLRYSLKPLTFDYIDIKEIIKGITGEEARKLSTEYEKWCEKPSSDDHKSSSDAFHTLEILRAISQKTGKTVSDLVEQFPSATGKAKGHKYGFFGTKIKNVIKILEEKRKRKAEQDKNGI